MSLGQQVDRLIKAYKKHIEEANKDTYSDDPGVQDGAEEAVLSYSEGLAEFKEEVTQAISKYDF